MLFPPPGVFVFVFVLPSPLGGVVVFPPLGGVVVFPPLGGTVVSLLTVMTILTPFSTLVPAVKLWLITIPFAFVESWPSITWILSPASATLAAASVFPTTFTTVILLV